MKGAGEGRGVRHLPRFTRHAINNLAANTRDLFHAHAPRKGNKDQQFK